jgi:hypothetical protein
MWVEIATRLALRYCLISLLSVTLSTAVMSSEKYQNKLNNLGKTRPSIDFIRMLLTQFVLKKKIIRWDNLPELKGENLIPKNDIFIVRLTVMTRSNLVTTDSKLKSSLESKNFLYRDNISISHPDELKNSYLRS